jgi:hypothetical protein
MEESYSKHFPELDAFNYDEYFKESIVYLYFHLTRKQNDEDIILLSNKLFDILDMLRKQMKNDAYYKSYYKILFNMIGYTRSIISDKNGCGKGENELTYMMIYVWYLNFPEDAIHAVKECFYKYGTWRDFPYLCGYVFKRTNNKFHSLIEHCIDIANTQLAIDLETWKFSINCFSREHISMVAKWIPREHKQFDWLHNRCVLNWAKKKFPHILDSALTDESYDKALNKCNRYYRKTFTTLNKALDTPQIKQCSQNIDKINPLTVSPITKIKQKRTLHIEPVSRLDDERQETRTVKGTRNVLPLCYFIKEAYEIINEDSQNNERITRLNNDWNDYSSKISMGGFHNMLPMIDVSSSMYEYNGISYYTAIGLAILISERSSLENRIMAYGMNPEWIILEKDTTFYQKVENIYKSIQSIQFGKSCLYKSLELIEKTVTDANQTTSSKIKHPILVIISNQFYSPNEEENYYTLPIQQRVIYWNVSTHMNTQLPCLYNQRNCIIMSGLSGGLLSNFKILKQYSRNKAYYPDSFIISILDSF